MFTVLCHNRNFKKTEDQKNLNKSHFQHLNQVLLQKTITSLS